MRRLLSITLLLLIGFPLIAPLFAMESVSEARLPACCRRNGAHHCMLSAEMLAALEHGQHWTVVHSKCPMYPVASASAHHDLLSFEDARLLSAGVLTHPAHHRQIEVWARVAQAGARQKRGPPAVRLS
jgi:hypothetical protein